MGARRAVFLDRDGTINVDRPDYVKSWREFRFLPLVFEALHRLACLDVEIVVVTNQSVIGRKITSPAVVSKINSWMVRDIGRHDGRVTAVYVCPHAPWANCLCRKPRPGLLLRAAQEYHLELSKSFMIGDQLSDVEVALAVGCQPILISPNHLRSGSVEPPVGLVLVPDLYHAVERIESVLKTDGSNREVCS